MFQAPPIPLRGGGGGSGRVQRLHAIGVGHIQADGTGPRGGGPRSRPPPPRRPLPLPLIAGDDPHHSSASEESSSLRLPEWPRRKEVA